LKLLNFYLPNSAKNKLFSFFGVWDATDQPVEPSPNALGNAHFDYDDTRVGNKVRIEAGLKVCLHEH
jgi:hypothetical protein